MQLERRRDALVWTRSEELAARVHARLSSVSREAAANPPRTSDTVLNGAYLVDREREAELEAALRELASELEPLGVTLELTGPWPAFNFTAPLQAAEAT
jgi:hypothetical protein